MWSSQTVVLSEREKWLRGRSILNVKSEQYLDVLLDHPPHRFLCQSSNKSHWNQCVCRETLEMLNQICLKHVYNVAGVTHSSLLKYI